MWCPALLSLSIPYLCCASNMKDRCPSRDGSCGSGGRLPRPRHDSPSDLALADTRRPMVLRPPRQGSVSESEGSCGSGSGSGSSSGGVFVDRTNYHYMYQDVTALKTLLLRLRRVLHTADTLNPFDANLRNSLYLSLASSEAGGGLNGEKDALTHTTSPGQDNVDLRRQVVLLQQQLNDRDRTIRLLQQQLSQSLSLHHHNTPTTTTPPPTTPTTTTTITTTATTRGSINAATQTERLARVPLTTSSLSRAASIDDGLGPTVSFEVEGEHRGRLRSTSNPCHHLHNPPRRTASQPPPPHHPHHAPTHR